MSCSAQIDGLSGMKDNELTAQMRPEFMASCDARPEYASRKREGTLPEFCQCIFDSTLKDLSDPERIIAGIYLYGESDPDYAKRYEMAVPDGAMMAAASVAIDRAVKRCK